MKIINVTQGTSEWFELRKRRMTASHAQAIATNGKGLVTYIRELMCGVFSTGEQVSYTNAAMDNGIEQEEVAAMLYEFETDNKTEIIGFVVLDDYTGVSPDRLVGENGLVEIKCPTDKVYFNLLLDKKIDSKYLAQMQMQMYVCERKWCDFVSYNPNFKQQLFIEKIYRDEAMITKIKIGLESGKKMIEEIEKKLKEF